MAREGGSARDDRAERMIGKSLGTAVELVVDAAAVAVAGAGDAGDDAEILVVIGDAAKPKMKHDAG